MSGTAREQPNDELHGDLVLVRHAPTQLDGEALAATWTLAPGARELTRALAASLAGLRLAAPGGPATPGGLDAVVTSHEPKAVGTGRLLASALGVPLATDPDLEEHHRHRKGILEQAAWNRTIRRFFANPEVLVFGSETAAEAGERFRRGVRGALARRPGRRLALVSHGTVITLLLAEPNGLDPFELWSSLEMPEAFVVRSGDLRIVERIGARE